MASPRSFTAEDASASIQRTGVFALDDDVVGRRIKEFSEMGFPIKSPFGLEFIALNSFARKDVRQVLELILPGRPHLGLIKVYSQVLPSDYVFRFHNGFPGEPVCLLVQLWSPGSIVCFYDRSVAHRSEADASVSRQWGLLATSKPRLDRDGVSKNLVNLEEGGLIVSDSRVHFSIVKGYAVMVGFPTRLELEHWGKMELPYSEMLKTKIDQLERGGVHVNYAWLNNDSPQ